MLGRSSVVETNILVPADPTPPQGACLITGNITDFPKVLRGTVEVIWATDYVVRATKLT